MLTTDTSVAGGDIRTAGECRTLRRLTDIDADGVAELVYSLGGGEVIVISDGTSTPMLRAGGYKWLD